MHQFTIELQNKKITKIGVRAIVDFYRTMAVGQLSFPGLNIFATGVDSSSLNVVLDTQDNNEYDAQKIKEIVNFFKDHSVPWSLFITAISETKEIEKHGFTLLYKSPGMYYDLSNALPNSMIEAEIKEQRGDLKEWIKPIQEGFPSNDNCETYRKLNAKLLQQGNKKLRHFTAYKNNEAASSGTLFLSEDSVMIHNLATKNKFRKSGIASALTLYMMNEAKKAGYKHCFLDSSDEGLNLYRRLGFKIYCITSVYENNNL